MKRIAIIVLALTMAWVLAACTKATLAIESNDDGIHAVAKGGAEGSGTAHITIDEGYGLCINHIVDKGIFHVTATNAQGEVIFDEDLTDNIADMVPAQGDIDVVISAKNAEGTIDIIAYDVEAQALADATLDEALQEAGVNREDTGLGSSGSAK